MCDWNMPIVRRMTMSDNRDIRCKECGRAPEEIREYKEAAADCEMTPTEYVIKEEGTFNRQTGKFWCTKCYIKIGQPLGKA
jgi:hypothetical protein